MMAVTPYCRRCVMTSAVTRLIRDVTGVPDDVSTLIGVLCAERRVHVNRFKYSPSDNISVWGQEDEGDEDEDEDDEEYASQYQLRVTNDWALLDQYRPRMSKTIHVSMVYGSLVHAVRGDAITGQKRKRDQQQ